MAVGKSKCPSIWSGVEQKQVYFCMWTYLLIDVIVQTQHCMFLNVWYQRRQILLQLLDLLVFGVSSVLWREMPSVVRPLVRFLLVAIEIAVLGESTSLVVFRSPFPSSLPRIHSCGEYICWLCCLRICLILFWTCWYCLPCSLQLLESYCPLHKIHIHALGWFIFATPPGRWT